MNNYVRTSSGSMMAVTAKSNTIISAKKQSVSDKKEKRPARKK